MKVLIIIFVISALCFGQDQSSGSTEVTIYNYDPIKMYHFSNGISGTSIEIGQFNFHRNSEGDRTTSISIDNHDFYKYVKFISVNMCKAILRTS